jgi:trk system potassium uptake protein TrkA
MRLKVHVDRSPSIGKALADIPTPRNTLVAAIGRDGRFIIPDGREKIEADDDLYLIGRTEALPEARDVLVGPHRKATKVVIIGASPVGRAIAQQLESTDITTCIVERDASKAEATAMELRHAEIYHGDGTQSDFLREEGLNNADVFVAVTKSDELNLMAGLLAKKMGVPTVIAVAHKPDYAPIYEELGIDTTISPRFLAAQAVLRYASRGWLISVGSLANGTGEVLEFHTSAGTPITSAPLKDVNFPKGARIGAVATEAEVTVPGGDFVVPPDARVIVFTTPDRRADVERLFRKKGLPLF